MQRGRSQQSRTLQAKLKNVIEKSKPHQSKGKNFLDSNHLANTQSYNKNITLNTSPSLIKQPDSDKQNIDVFETVLKIVSAAADAREKQILLSLASHLHKQKKIRSYMAQKQKSSQKIQLQAMLTHLRQEEMKDISSLKIQIGKRKLQNLDQHDLGENILSLNSYVMRRTKKQSSILKSQGVDLIGQIYNKFDEQSKIIAQMLGGERAASRLNIVKEKPINEELNSHQSTLINCKTTQQYVKDQKQRISSGKFSDISEGSSSSDLMHKILRLQKQNLRLMKEIGKIEEEFECVVQEKLLLEEKIERVKASYRHTKNKIGKCLNQLRSQFNEQKDMHDNSRRGIVELLKQQKKHFYQQLTLIQAKILDNPATSVSSKDKIATPDHINNSPFSFQREKESPDYIRSSIESECSVLERYQALLTQKQMQINTVLKSISKIKQENQTLVRSLNQQKEIVEKFKNKMNQNIKTTASELSALRDMMIKTAKFVMNQIQQFVKQKDQITQELGQRLLSVIEQFNNLSQKNQNLNTDLLNKENQLKRSEQKIKCIQTQSKNWQEKYEQQTTQNEKEKKKLAQQITKIQDILKSEQQKAKQSIDLIRNSIVQESNKNITGKQAQIEKIEKQKQLLLQQNEQLKKQIQILQEQCQKYNVQIMELENVWSLKEKQLNQKIEKSQRDENLYIKKQKYDEKMKQMEEQFLNRQSLMIEECGMLLQGKNQEINSIKLLVERQRIAKQDLLSSIHERDSKNLGYVQKKKLEKVLASIIQELNQVKKNRKQILYLQEQLKKQFKSSLSLFFTQFQSIFSNLFQKSRSQTLSYEHEVVVFTNIPLSALSFWQKQIDQMWILLVKNLAPQENSQKNIENKFQALKNMIISLNEQLVNKRKQVDRLELEKREKFEQIQKQSEKIQLNEYETLSHEGELQKIKSENSSFLCELQPFKFENLLGEQTINLSQIINQSAIVDEICALRNELAESLKRNQNFKRELKIYQQKDIDKIFDF